jgi:hypothetical protein
VLNGAGRIVSTISGPVGIDHGIQVDLSGQAPGIYVLRVLQNGTTFHHRAVKTQ